MKKFDEMNARFPLPPPFLDARFPLLWLHLMDGLFLLLHAMLSAVMTSDPILAELLAAWLAVLLAAW